MVRSTSWTKSTTVPTMTSDTVPAGRCICSAYNSGQEAYRAFDRNDSTMWNSGETTVPQWIGYKFSEYLPVSFAKVKFNSTYHTSSVVKIQRSDDGSIWEDASDEVSISGGTETVIMTDSSTHLYWRMYIISQDKSSSYVGITVALDFCSTAITDNATAMNYIGASEYASSTLLANSDWCSAICNSTYFESVLTTKVPQMTSNTTPSGEVISSVSSSSSYYAFDRNNDNSTGQTSDNTTAYYIGYMFAEPITVNKATITEFYFSRAAAGGITCSGKIVIQGSSDNSTWIDLSEPYTFNSGGTSSITYSATTVFNNESKYQYYRLYVYDRSGAVRALIRELQFYGR